MSTTPPAERPELRRPEDDRWVAGVCSGIARQLGVAPLVVRIVAIVLAFSGGVGLLLYVVGVLVVPSEGQRDSLARRAIDGEGRALALGLLLCAFVLWAAGADGWFFGFGWGPGWGLGPLVLVGLAVWFFLSRRDRDAAAAPPAAVAASDPEAPTAIAAAPARPRPRSSGRIALGVTLVGVAVVGLIGAIAGDDVRWDVLLAATVIALGAALVIAAPFGGARMLIPLGLLLAAGTGIAAAADLQLKGGAGERVYRPQVWTEVRPQYNLAAGRQELDLRQLALPDGTTKIKVEQGFGELIIRVPEHSRVNLDAHVAGGDIEALDRDSNGFDADVDVNGDGRGPVLDIDAHVGFGYIGIARGNDPVGDHRNHRFGPGAITVGGLR